MNLKMGRIEMKDEKYFNIVFGNDTSFEAFLVLENYLARQIVRAFNMPRGQFLVRDRLISLDYAKSHLS